jgi:hypothetical protein
MRQLVIIRRKNREDQNFRSIGSNPVEIALDEIAFGMENTN